MSKMTAGPVPEDPSRQRQFSLLSTDSLLNQANGVARSVLCETGRRGLYRASNASDSFWPSRLRGERSLTLARTDVHSRPVQELMKLLGDIDDAAVVVVAGNLFHPEPTSDLVRFVDATLAALPALCEKIAAFTTNPRHRFIVLPERGSRTEVQSGRARSTRATRGRLRERSDPERGHGNGVRDLAVARARAPSTRRAPTSTIAPTRIVSKTRTHCRASSPLACCTADWAVGSGSR